MSLMRKIVVGAVFLFVAASILSPNPYGNNPDIVLDESYFLTSALSSIQNMRPPGWDFPLSGAYYGGPQVYVDTAVMMPVVGSVVAFSNFSLTDAKVWIALHTGELLHILRLVNGALAIAALAFLAWYFSKRRIPRELAEILALYALLLLSNVLVIQFLHTAKVWALHIVLVSVIGAIFLAQEYYRAHLSAPFLPTRRYTAIFLWIGALVAFQTYIGAISVAFLLAAALWLRHLSWRDVWIYVIRYWWAFALFALTQISFLYQAYRISDTLKNATTRTADGVIDWTARLGKPLVYALQAQPLILLALAAVCALLFALYHRRETIDRARVFAYLLLACAYPVATYVIFHVIVGFDVAPRYAILMTLALTFSAALLMIAASRALVRIALVLATALALVVGIHAIQLYWQPSSERVLLAAIEAQYNSPQHVFITDHAARRLTLPVNNASLDLLNDERRAMSRFAFLLQARDAVQKQVDFAPLTMTAYVDEEMAAYTERFKDERYSVWVVSADCSRRCSAEERDASTCFEINVRTCAIYPHEPNTLPVFFGADQLGYGYIVRNVH